MSAESPPDPDHPAVVIRLWGRLRVVKRLAFTARSAAETATGWVGGGRGIVEVETINDASMIFRERGEWTPTAGRALKFSNAFRWTINEGGASLRLEHLRFGAARPVLLFDLAPAGDDVLESKGAHECRLDAYKMRMEWAGGPVRVRWSVEGPGKREAIDYEYG